MFDAATGKHFDDATAGQIRGLLLRGMRKYSRLKRFLQFQLKVSCVGLRHFLIVNRNSVDKILQYFLLLVLLLFRTYINLEAILIIVLNLLLHKFSSRKSSYRTHLNNKHYITLKLIYVVLYGGPLSIYLFTLFDNKSFNS